MNQTTKIILGVILALCVLCLAGFIVLGMALIPAAQRTFSSQPAVQVSEEAVQVQAGDDSFITFDLPAGFTSTGAVNLGDLHMLSYTGSDERSHIFFLQVPATVHMDAEAMIERMQSQSVYRADHFHLVGTDTVTIDGQSVEVTTSEGETSSGESYRVLTGMFQGSKGTIMLMYEAPADNWDQAALDAFLASIHE